MAATCDTKIVNISVKQLRPEYENLLEWLENPNHIYIGRNMEFYVPGAKKSKWHNPFKVKQMGIDESLNRYEKYIRESELINELDELRGKVLGCWCKPNKCHGDVLIKLINENQ